MAGERRGIEEVPEEGKEEGETRKSSLSLSDQDEKKGTTMPEDLLESISHLEKKFRMSALGGPKGK